MAALSRKLRSVVFDVAETKRGIGFWCPGCEGAHTICTNGPTGTSPIWQWDGNVDAPTISPSIMVHEVANVHPRCHSLIRAGQIEFLGDCTHSLAGKTVDLPDWPEGYE